MIVKIYSIKLKFLFIILSVLWGTSKGKTSAQSPSISFEQFISMTQLISSDDTDTKLYFQDKIEKSDDLSLVFSDNLTVSAFFDSAYRSTNFYESGHHTIISQGDSRIELWIPPGHQSFSWGPYVRFAGLTSDHSQAWENAWLSNPGFGFHVYPFSGTDYRNDDKEISKVLGPLRLFAEYNKMDYWGSENVWRPDEQVRIGADYWKAMYVNNTYNPWWTEIWSGLSWQSANEFDKDYDTLILGNAVRFGFRKPDAGILSTVTPYFAVESSLTENREYYWENRLLHGGGIRFAPLLYEKKDKSSWLTRFIIYAEYLGVSAYYRDSAPSSVPDYDFRVGINFSIGEWYN